MKNKELKKEMKKEMKKRNEKKNSKYIPWKSLNDTIIQNMMIHCAKKGVWKISLVIVQKSATGSGMNKKIAIILK